MTKDTTGSNHDALKKDLEDLNSKIKSTLENGGLSQEGLKTLIKEAEEIQKRLIDSTESAKDRKEDT